MRSQTEILADLDEVSRQLDSLSRHVEYLVDELDPKWRKRKEAERKKSLEGFKL